MRIIVLTLLLGLIAADPTDPKTIELPSFGVTVPIPDGWRRVREPDESIALRLELIDPKSKEPQGIIDVQLYPRRLAPSAKALAQSEAKRLGGRMNPEAVELAGVEAFEFAIEPKTEKNVGGAALRSRFIKHGRNYYALCERGAIGATRDTFDQLASKIVLSEPTPPSDALRDRKDPFPITAAQLMFDLPDPFRLASDGTKLQEYRVINFATEKSEVEMSVRPISLGGEDFAAMLPTIGRNLAKQMGWSEPPAWHRVEGKLNIAYTDLIPGGQDEKGKPINPMQLMLVSNKGASQMMIIQYPGAADATAKYAAKWEQIARSVRVDATPRK